MPAVPGAQVSPNVRLLEPLGRGGMGSVWVAEHSGLHTRVAVKLIAEALAHDAGIVARFQREATAAAQIKSPHVVQVFDHGLMDGAIPYIVMELLEGEDLSRRIERTGPLNLDDTVTVVSQVGKALGKAHELGIVHRDIKPENIFLCDMGGSEIFVKVLDFGIAKDNTGEHSANITSTGHMVGTPSAMSPEQILSSKSVDHRSDLWSLGVVAYQCLTGHAPFEAETFGALAVAIDRATFPPVSSRRAELPPRIDAWFARALARDREHRFASAKEMVDELARAAANTSSSVRVVTDPGALKTGVMLGPTLAGTTAGLSTPPSPRVAWFGLAVVGVLGAAGAFLLSRGHASPEAVGGEPARTSRSSAPAPEGPAPEPPAVAVAPAVAAGATAAAVPDAGPAARKSTPPKRTAKEPAHSPVRMTPPAQREIDRGF